MNVKPGKQSEFLEIFKNKIVNQAIQERGLQKLYLFRSEKSQEYFALSFWEKKEDAIEYVEKGDYNEVVEKLSSVLNGEQKVSGLTIEVEVVGQNVS